MSEIKSAIELAMERTRNLVMDDEEKRQASVRDREQKMTALLRRFMENMIDERRFLNEYELIAGDPGVRRLSRTVSCRRVKSLCPSGWRLSGV